MNNKQTDISTADQHDGSGLRALSAEEIKAVAGGPRISNEPRDEPLPPTPED